MRRQLARIAITLSVSLATPVVPAAGQATTYGYDANGNVVSKLEDGVAWTYVYDTRNLLVEVQRDGLLVETYQYDYRGHRIRKAGPDGVVRYVWDGDRILLETDDFGNTIAKYEYADDRLLAIRHESEGTAFYLFDALGSPVALSELDGSLAARYSYDAWGAIRRTVGASANEFLFTAYQFDEATGLYYAKARYYDPRIARFTTEDPERGEILQPPSLHRYLYAYVNPLVYTDPDGRASYLSDWEAYTDDTVARYDTDIDRAAADGASGRAFALGVGRGLASLGNKVVRALNSASNALARELYDGATYEQAQREIAANQLAMTDAMESVHHTAVVIKEDPSGAARALHVAAVGFAVDVAMGDPRAMAGLGEFAGQLVLPASTAKGLKIAGDTLGTVRPALRMSDGFLDAGMLDEIEDVSRAAGRAADPAKVRINQFEGVRRETETLADLRVQYPNARIQSQVYLRTADGKWARDPLTGEARRLDFVVIENGRVLDVVETTSIGARKTEQFRKEQRIRAEGGTFIRDRIDRCLLDACDVQTREDRRR